MNIFIVRHALTSDGEKHLWQSPDSKLSKIGRLQTKSLAERSRFREVKQIFSSEMTRSIETANIISEVLGIPVKKFEVLRERKQTSKIYKADYSSQISQSYLQGSQKNFMNLDWKFKPDEESIRNVIERVKTFIKFLESVEDKDSVLIISHDIFIRIFVILCTLGMNIEDKIFIRMLYSICTAPTGITLMTHRQGSSIWKLKYLNDYSHSRL